MGMEGNDPTLAQPPGRPSGVGGYDPTVPVERVPDYGGPDGPGGPGGPGGGNGEGDGGGEDDDARRRRILLYSLGGIAAILIIVIIILLATGGGDDKNKPTSSTSTSTTSTSTTSTSTTSTSTTSSPTTAPLAPTITSFTNDTPNCQTNQINLHWTTQNAVGVDISIDGPGKYQSYGASGSAQVPFVCGGSHTYLLTAKGANGSTSQRMITVQSPPVTTTSSSTTSTTT
jgi:hypothetical protein